MGLPYGASAGATFTIGPDGQPIWSIPANNGAPLDQMMTNTYNQYLDGQGLTDPTARDDWFRMNGMRPYDPASQPAAPTDAPMAPADNYGTGQTPATGGGWLSALGGIGAAPQLEHTIANGLGYNPQLQAQIDQLKTQFTDTLNNQMLPAVDRPSIMAGTYGGAKNGVAEGVATGNAAKGFAQAATGLLSNDWEQQQGRDLQKYGMDQGFYLGNQGQMLNFASDQRGQDRQDLMAGASLYGQGVMGPWGPLGAANSIYGNYTGFGNSTTSNNSGGGWLGWLGGAGAGYQLYNGWAK